MSTVTQLVTRLSRDTLVFVAASATTVVLAFVTVAVVTSHLAPAEYGRLAIYYFFAALLTILYNLVLLSGTLLRVFGASGEEDVEDDDRVRAPLAFKRRALTTGLLLTVGLIAVGTLVVTAAADPLSKLLLGTTGDDGTLVLAAVSGGMGAIWRLVSNVSRFETRPWKYAGVTNARPVLVLASIVLVLADGGGVTDVIAANVTGTGAAITLAMLLTWRNYAPSFAPGELRPIVSSGLIYVPLIVGMWIVQNVDLFILSRYAPDAEVGIYRLANRVGSVVSYAVSAFLLAWVPVSRTSIFDAARRKHGVAGLGNLLVTYFAFSGIWLLLGLGVGANALARVAPPAYGKAAPLIPLVGLGFVAYGLFVVVYRAASFPNRRRLYFGFAWVAAAVLIAVGLLLVPRFGSYGAAWAVVAAFGVACAGMLILSERGPNPLRIPWWRVGAAGAVAALCYLASDLKHGGLSTIDGVVDVCAVLGYPVLLVVLRILPREHVRPILAAVAGLGSGRPARRRLVERLRALSPGDREALRSAVAGRPGADIRDSVRALRQLSGGGEPGELDDEIGRYLLAREALAERDARFRRLRHEGVDPLELHQLELTVSRLRELPRRAWSDLLAEDRA